MGGARKISNGVGGDINRHFGSCVFPNRHFFFARFFRSFCWLVLFTVFLRGDPRISKIKTTPAATGLCDNHCNTAKLYNYLHIGRTACCGAIENGQSSTCSTSDSNVANSSLPTKIVQIQKGQDQNTLYYAVVRHGRESGDLAPESPALLESSLRLWVKLANLKHLPVGRFRCGVSLSSYFVST